MTLLPPPPNPHPLTNCGPLAIPLQPGENCPTCGTRVGADPAAPCYHLNFDATVRVARIGEGDDDNPTPAMPTAFVAEVVVECSYCGEPFRFEGVPAGLSYDAPATSVDGRELRAPIRPASMPPRSMTRRAGDVTGFRITLDRAGE